MDNVKRIQVFVGGTGNFNEKKKIIRDIIDEFMNDHGKIEDHVAFIVTPPIRPDDEPYPDSEQKNVNKYAESCNLMFMFFENGIGTCTTEVKDRLYKEPLVVYKKLFDKIAAIEGTKTVSGSVEELLIALTSESKPNIYAFFKVSELDKIEIKKFKETLQETFKITIKQYTDNTDITLRKAIISYLKLKYNQAKTKAKTDFIEGKKPSQPMVFPKNGISAYSEMSDILDKTTYLLSYNFKSDLPKPKEEGPRSAFISKLENRMMDYAKRHNGSPLHFTRISSFTNIGKLLDALNEINRVINTVSINLIYHPYLHLHQHSNSVNIFNKQEIVNEIESEYDFAFSDDYEEHASLVLFGSEQDKYNFGIWGLFGDHETDGKYSSAILFPDLDEYDPISEYGTKLKSCFERIAPLCISFPDIIKSKTKQKIPHAIYKEYYEGFYPSNFNVLLKMLEKHSANGREKFDKNPFEKLCEVCKKINKSHIICIRKKLSPLFSRICTDIIGEKPENIKCINCKF